MFSGTELLWINLFGIACFGVGYWIGHRTWTGVKSDLGDVKQDLANIKGVLTPTPVAVPAPVVLPTPAITDGTPNTRSK